VLFVSALPPVEAGAADSVVPARSCDVAGHFFGVLQDRQASLGLAQELLFGHLISFSSKDPGVNNLRQFFTTLVAAPPLSSVLIPSYEPRTTKAHMP
jgi:hypothetical protein